MKAAPDAYGTVHLGGQVFPRDAGLEDKQDAGEGLPVEEWGRPPLGRRHRGKNRFDERPQSIGQQRLGHPWRAPIGDAQCDQKTPAEQAKLEFLKLQFLESLLTVT